MAKAKEEAKVYEFIGGSGYGPGTEFTLRFMDGKILKVKAGDPIPADRLTEEQKQKLLSISKIREVK